MMKYTSVLFVLCLFGCGSEPQESISMSDILPQSERYKEGQVDEVHEEEVANLFDSLSLWTKTFVRTLGLDSMSLKINEQLFVVDRMSFNSKMAFDVLMDSTALKVFTWSFKDSLDAKNAFLFGWMLLDLTVRL